MRQAGRITDWNDDKGFGFVMPNGGGERAFVHVNEFQRGSRRPVQGDLISYLPGRDACGRLAARQVRHAGQRLEARRTSSRLPRRLLGGSALAAVAALAALHVLPAPLALAYAAASALSFLMYRTDKSAAQSGRRRTPEATLHLVDLAGGWPGALIAQQRYHHKTVKRPFQAAFWSTVVLNVAGVGWLVSSGDAKQWAALLAG